MKYDLLVEDRYPLRKSWNGKNDEVSHSVYRIYKLSSEGYSLLNSINSKYGELLKENEYDVHIINELIARESLNDYVMGEKITIITQRGGKVVIPNVLIIPEIL
jgi:hypothetical protein